MAIDGVKIIDSDDGHDIYNLIVERYRDGTSIDTIVSEILAEEQNFCTDEFYTCLLYTSKHCYQCDQAYGEGIAKALGMDIDFSDVK